MIAKNPNSQEDYTGIDTLKHLNLFDEETEDQINNDIDIINEIKSDIKSKQKKSQSLLDQLIQERKLKGLPVTFTPKNIQLGFL